MAAAIVELWVAKIEQGKRTLDEVPAKLKEQVIERLIEDGFIVGDEDGGDAVPAGEDH